MTLKIFLRASRWLSIAAMVFLSASNAYAGNGNLTTQLGFGESGLDWLGCNPANNNFLFPADSGNTPSQTAGDGYRGIVIGQIASVGGAWLRTGPSPSSCYNGEGFTNTVKTVKANNMQMLMMIMAVPADLNPAEWTAPTADNPITDPSTQVKFSDQCGTPYAIPLSKIDLTQNGPYVTRITALLNQIKSAGLTIDAFEIGNELDSACSNGDLPFVSNAQPSLVQVQAAAIAYANFYAATAGVIRQSFPNAQIITFGVENAWANPSTIPPNSPGSPIAIGLQLDPTSLTTFFTNFQTQLNSLGANYSQIVNGYGVHIYQNLTASPTCPLADSGIPCTDGMNQFETDVGIFGNQNIPFWVTEWGIDANPYYQQPLKDVYPAAQATAAQTFLTWMQTQTHHSVANAFYYTYETALNPPPASKPANDANYSGSELPDTFRQLATPVCSLNASSTTIQPGSSVTLSATCSPAAINGYTWTTNCNAALTSTAGTVNSITVSPTVTTQYCVTGMGSGTSLSQKPASVTVTVSSLPAPTCTLSASPSSVAPGGLVTLTANCSPAATDGYTWNGGTLTSSALHSATATANPTAATTYYVQGWNDTGGSPAAPATVTMLTAPTCTLSASPTVVAPGGQVTLTASCTPAATAGYTWNGGALTSHSQYSPTATASPTAATTYYVQGWNGAGGSPAVPVTVSMLTAPTCTLSANPTAVAPGGQVTLTANCTPAATDGYTWAGGALTSHSQYSQTATASPTAATTYWVQGWNGAGGSAGVPVTVSMLTAPVCTLTASPSHVAPGGQVTLTANCTPAATDGYTWAGGALTSHAQYSPTATASPTATTSYWVQGWNDAGGSAGISATVTVP